MTSSRYRGVALIVVQVVVALEMAGVIGSSWMLGSLVGNAFAAHPRAVIPIQYTRAETVKTMIVGQHGYLSDQFMVVDYHRNGWLKPDAPLLTAQEAFGGVLNNIDLYVVRVKTGYSVLLECGTEVQWVMRSTPKRWGRIVSFHQENNGKPCSPYNPSQHW